MTENMNPEELKKQLQLRDRAVRVISEDGHFRAVAVKNTTTVQTAQKNHNLDYISSLLLARLMSAASMMASFLKGEERIVLEMQGNGPISKIYAESMQLGENRGFVEYAKDVTSRAPVNNIKDAVGLGLLAVTKYFYNKGEPVSGVVPLQGGDVSSDIAYYYSQSEQIPTAVILDVDFDENNVIKDSGGLMVQAMPGATKEEIDKLYKKMMQITQLTKFYSDGLNPKQTMEKLLPFEFKLLNSTQVDFFCRCSKDSFIEKLVTLNSEEIIDMQEQGQNELICRYCNTHYYLEEEDFAKIIEETNAKKN
jgi:molecular chaperone Hsp33